MPKRPVKKKLVLIGPGFIGKTSLLQAALQDQFPPTEQPFKVSPGIYGCIATNEDGTATRVSMVLWDTPGSFEWDRFAPLRYPNASVVVIAYAIDRPDYFELIEERCLPEIDHFVPGVPIILIGLRKDTRDDADVDDPRPMGDRFVSRRTAEEEARRIGALEFVECSSVTGEGVQEVFEAAARATLCGPKRNIANEKRHEPRRGKKCVVL